uniref:PyrG1 n=1 Tax=Streptomyces rugosporus TaxID=295838 RepID=K7QRJ0_STRRG|nr:PyrG1 [Streptomyces rugosporus]
MTAPGTPGLWVRRFHASPDARVRLLVLPHAGGSASYYFTLSRDLAPEVEVLVAQYPGRQDRLAEGCAGGIEELADGILAELRADPDGRPLALFGHSMGTVVAFEVARRLERAPVWLFASGYPAPSRLRGGDVHLRDDAGIVAEIASVGGTDPAWLADESLLSLILPSLRADYGAAERHPRGFAVLDCPITALVGDRDPYTTEAEAAAWGEHTAAGFDLRVFAGGHFCLEQHAATFTEIMAGALRSVTPGTARSS